MKTLIGACALLWTSSLLAAEWNFEWVSSSDESAAVKAEICPLKYGKVWAYSFEIDDGPECIVSTVEPLFKRFEFTDAPPGVSGGRPLPFVGGAAIMFVRAVTINHAFLGIDQLNQLETKGWRVLNHSYWHTGNHWDPAKKLTPAQFRRELYWSQALYAALLGNGRADTHLVYPNGDYNYREYLAEFGIRSASRVGGKTKTLTGPAESLLDLDRNWLDQTRWEAAGDALYKVPETEPLQGDFMIDFTHLINADPASDNNLRWVQRLTAISSRFGKGGSDTLWCAPTSEVTAYTLASRDAKAEVRKGRLRVTLPDTAPGSSLTIKLSGISPRSQFKAPEGGVIHRKGGDVWITTPLLGKRGAEAPKPLLKRIYQGPAVSVKLPSPAKIAGVRLQQAGNLQQDLKITLITPSGTTDELVPPDQEAVKQNWGVWLLYPTVPDRPAVLTKEVIVTPDPALREMEIWATAE
jgi:peptidoglycan/xylan/chitin deacetylase (PgdA/CDA1 family)